MRTISSKLELTSTQEDYIRAIYLLSKDGDGATVTGIAKKLELSKSTVSERLKELSAANLAVAPPYGKVTLTKKGKILGEKLTFKHRLLEVFLYQTLKMPKDAIHEEAERLEHALSDDVAKRMAKFLNSPTHDPHGSKIPTL